MGYCKVGSGGEACDPADCKEVEGQYVEPGKGNCFLLSLLGDERAILLTQTTIYPSLIEFREKVLRRTELGRRFVGYFDEFYDEAKAIGRENPELVTDVVWMAVYVSPFVQAMLGQRPYTGSPGETVTGMYATEFRRAPYHSTKRVIEKFKLHASDGFNAALDDFEETLERFVGLSPEGALRELRRDPEAATSRIAR